MNLWSLVARTRTRPACSVCCTHCGLPAPAPCFREGSESELAFCCRACCQVYDLMDDLMDDLTSEERPFACAD